MLVRIRPLHCAILLLGSTFPQMSQQCPCWLISFVVGMMRPNPYITFLRPQTAVREFSPVERAHRPGQCECGNTASSDGFCRRCRPAGKPYPAARPRPVKRNPRAVNKTQTDRESILRRLGFGSYEIYLQSDLWKRIRAAVFAEYGWRCVRCGCEAHEIHHKGYGERTMTGESLSALVPICGECHRYIHFDGETRLSLSKANLRLLSTINDSRRSG